jgi:hypothetical protein
VHSALAHSPTATKHMHKVPCLTPFLGHIALKRVPEFNLHQREPQCFISKEGTEGYELQCIECNKQMYKGPLAHPHKYNCTHSIHPTNAHDPQLMSRSCRLSDRTRTRREASHSPWTERAKPWHNVGLSHSVYGAVTAE